MIALKEMEVRSRKASQIFMEAPYRNNQFLDFLIKNLQKDTKLCVAVDIEKEGKETNFQRAARFLFWAPTGGRPSRKTHKVRSHHKAQLHCVCIQYRVRSHGSCA